LLRFLRFAVPPLRLGLRSRSRKTLQLRAWIIDRIPKPDSLRRWQDLPGSWRTPLWTCPALRPRWDLCARPLPRFDVVFHQMESVDSHDKY